MKLLITPQEVVEIAFNNTHEADPDLISEAVIISAESRFIKPALGKMYEQITNGIYSEFIDDYIKPALAFYVKYLSIPAISAQIGVAGVTLNKGDYYGPASERQVAELKKHARSEANALLKRAVDHIEDNNELYPEYDRSDNILNKVSIKSNIIL